ncbi:TIGR01459 family HAD-type hydrolase [Pyruvatibacter sp.]|uniref:TIGR01459 family HAD-type hydrolase n=1 Tax=Pyruvatibacter sp. TaxID=1981328 RepID=UPI0032ED442F
MSASFPVSTKLISDLSQIAPDYDAILCDVWGVIHNGQRPHDAACAALARFRRERGPVILVSNSPRPVEGIPPQLATIGVPEDAWDAIVTSGDATRMMVKEGDFGSRCFHLGPQRDHLLFEAMNVTRSGDAEAPADFIICTGPWDDETETAEDYRSLFAGLISRKLPMICANPDLVVERGDRLITCAGALAKLYGDMGGTAHYAGKPHPPIYRLAREMLANLGVQQPPDAWNRVLFIGDGLPTDIPGAQAQGLDALFITSGIHAGEFGSDPDHPDADKLTAVLSRAGLSPQHAMPRLVWK